MGMTRKSTLWIVALFMTSPGSALATYQRLYQGYLLPTVDPASFEKSFNQNFLPLFVEAHPQGLTNYRPALSAPRKDCALPAEIALLTFASEESYAKYRETEIGKRIRAAHEPIFDGKASKSLIPEPWTGTAKPGYAYETSPHLRGFVPTSAALVIHCGARADPASLTATIRRSHEKPSGIRDVIFALEADHMIEYVFFDRPETAQSAFQKRKKLLSGAYRHSVLIPLEKAKIGAKQVRPGKGLEAVW